MCLLMLVPLALLSTFGPELTVGEMILPALLFPLLWMGVLLEGSLAEGLHPANRAATAVNRMGQMIFAVMVSSCRAVSVNQNALSRNVIFLTNVFPLLLLP